MFDVNAGLQPGLQAAEARINAAQATVARANVGAGGRSANAAMAQAAQAAIFDEALLNAVHARLAEIKAVTK